MKNPVTRRTTRSAATLSLSALLALASLGVAPANAVTPQPLADTGTSSAAFTTENAAAPEKVSQFIVKYKTATAAKGKSARANAWGKAAKDLSLKPQELRSIATGGTLVDAGRSLDSQDAAAFMQKLQASGDVEYVEPNARMTAMLTPNDPSYSQQWDFTADNGMRIPGAWDRSTGRGVTVAVIDTGITSHPDLAGNILPGYDFISNAADARDGNGRDSNPQDEGDWYGAYECDPQDSRAANSSWHGTHVAGTIAAVTNNGVGVAGVAPDAKVVPVRVLGKCGGTTVDIAEAIIWASGGTVSGVPANPNPAQVINMSLGGSGACSTTYQNAINSAVGRGTTVVVAAGNSAANAANSQPGNCNNVVSIAASNASGTLSYYSNYGNAVDLTAPGGDTRTTGGGILSTLNSGTTTPGSASYAWYQGTSMATPHVAGLVALMKGLKPNLTPAQVESLLKQGTRPMPGGCSLGCGAGLSDATATLNLTAAS